MRVRLFALLGLFGCSIFPPLAAAPPRWIRDGSGLPPRLSVEQSLWAMGGLPRGAREWTLEEKVARIAGEFDGFMVFLPPSAQEQKRYAGLARQHGLAITLQCAPANLADLDRALEAVRRMGARGLVAMIRPTFVTYEEGARKIREMMDASSEAGVPFYVETHRGTITQDLLLSGMWAREIPGIRFHADLSHFVISYEITGPRKGRIDRAFDAILRRTGMIDGRVGNGEQVQIDIGPSGDDRHARMFAAWWKKAMVRWLRDATPGDIFVFKSELGPPNYSIVGPDGRELSDRWAQALVMRDLGIRVWNEAVEESGRGLPYEAKERKEKKAAVAASGKSPKTDGDASAALEVEESGIPVLRGDSFRIGDFHLGGQPLQPDFDIAKEKGIRTVINVRLDRELAGLGFEEDRTIRELGLAYIHIPVGPETIDDALAAKFLEAMEKAEKPVLLHGSNGNRVWGLWALWVGMKHGIPVDETAKVAASCGVRKLVVDEFVRDYLKRKKGLE